MSTFSLQLFPLQTVLYPHCMLPLHIFEPRYRSMIQMCLEFDVPFGVIMIRSGMEVGGRATTADVGTVARIRKVVTLDDGRMFITTYGERRFKLLESGYDGECMTGVVEPYEDEEPHQTGSEQMGAEVRKLFYNYWKLLGLVSNKELGEIELPEEPDVLSWLIPSVLHIPLGTKQSLLESTDCLERLRVIHQLLVAEIEKMLTLVREIPGN